MECRRKGGKVYESTIADFFETALGACPI